MELTSVYAQFEWETGVTPLSSPAAPAIGICVYLAFTFGLRSITGRKPIGVHRSLVALHNLVLFGASGVMFIGCAYEAATEVSRVGSTEWLFCLPIGTPVKGPIFLWSYVYYLSKYYELLDTVILVLKGKPLTFLHVFHHSAVMVMAYLWLESAQSLQVLGLLFNTGVHVIMYYYYFLCSLGLPPPWKKIITNVQIFQFVSSFLLSIPFWWMHFKIRPCSGFNAMVFNAVFNLMLLALFINFHLQSYRRSKRKAT